MHLDYTAIRVQDLLKSLRFYARGLGLLEIRRGSHAAGGTWILLEDPVSRQRLELNWYPPGSRNDTPWRNGEELHRLAVRSRDVATVAERLRAAGASDLSSRRRVPSAESDSVLLEDPNGIVIELLPEHPELVTPLAAEA
ncbi:MAG TPA: VOC family protein [Thermoplasmata archaeon]|nr:VOC family protein [Thermoplasmata archaeon]